MDNSPATLEHLFSAVPLLRVLPQADRAFLANQLQRRTFPRDWLLFGQGLVVDDCMYFIQRGSVQITLSSADGNNLMLVQLREGDFFGELALIDNRPRSANAVVVDDCVLQTLSKAAFRELIMRRPEAALQVMEVLSERLRESDVLIQEATFFDVRKRLATRLLRHAGCVIGDDGKLIRKDPTLATDYGRRGLRLNERLTQQALANEIGTRRESVATAMSDFKKAGLLKKERASNAHIHLLDIEALADVVRIRTSS